MQITNSIKDGVQDDIKFDPRDGVQKNVEANIENNSVERQCYPNDLAEFILPLLQSAHPKTAPCFESGHGFEMPCCSTLKAILSCAYQASIQTDEQRPVTFRLIFGAPSAFPKDEPDDGLHCFEFANTIPFDTIELKKLSSAAAYHRTLIGVFLDEQQELRIWGCVHSGPRWLKALQGGRANVPAMPPALVLRVTAPGHIEVAKGSTTVGQLSEGRIYGPSMNVFMSQWLVEAYSLARSGNLELHLAARANSNQEWADLDPDCLRILGQNLHKRMLAATRANRHGGTILWVPADFKEQLLTDGNPYIDLKYKFAAGETRLRMRRLLLEILNRLAQMGGSRDGKRSPVGWADYESSNDPLLNQLDDAIFEMSNFVANLTGTDGAVVLTQTYELLGFGGEIRCNDHEISRVARAIDLEGDNVCLESIHRVGTRHRSAYRFSNAIEGSIAQVISQDGNVRFVKRRNDVVTYWDHQAVADSFE